MKKWLLFTAYALSVIVAMPQVGNAAQYTPYRQDNAPVSRFYDPAPALTGDYYDKTSSKRITTTRDMQQNTAAPQNGQMMNQQKNTMQQQMVNPPAKPAAPGVGGL